MDPNPIRVSVFCAQGARSAAMRSSSSSALEGWWTPLGPALTLSVIAENAFGDRESSETEAPLLMANVDAGQKADAGFCLGPSCGRPECDSGRERQV